MTRMLAPMVAPAMMPTGNTSTGDGDTLAGDRGQRHCQGAAAAGRSPPSLQPRDPAGLCGVAGTALPVPFSSSWMMAVPGPKLFQAVQL